MRLDLPTSTQPYGSQRLLDCYRMAADAFGWARSDPDVGVHAGR